MRRGEARSLVPAACEGNSVFPQACVHHPCCVFVEEMRQGAVVLGPDGTVLHCHRGLAALLGVPREQVVGTYFHPVVAPECQKAYGQLLAESARRRAHARLALVAGKDTRIPVRVAARSVSSAGSITTCLVITDLTKRRRTKQALRDHEAEMRALLETAISGVICADERGIIELFNPAAERMFGYRAEEILGKNVAILAPAPHSELHDSYIAHYIGTGEKKVIGKGREIEGRRKDGSLVPLQAALSEYRVGGRRKFTAIFSDLSETKQAERARKESEERMRLAVEAADLGVVLFNPATLMGECSDRCLAILGLSPDRRVSYDTFLQCVHPEDRGRIDFAKAAALDPTGAGRFDDEFRTVWPDGTMHWVIIRGQVHFEGEVPARRAIQGIGIMADVTPRKQAEESLRQSERRFHELADAMPQIVWSARVDGFRDYFNERWYEFTGFPRGDGMDRWETILHPDDFRRGVDAWNAAVQTGQAYEMEYRFKDHKTGGYRWHLGRALPVQDESGHVVRWYGTCTDIDDQKRAEEQVRAFNATLEQRVADRTAALERSVADLSRSEKALQQQTAVLRAILNSVGEAIIVANAQGEITLVNPAAEQLHGISDFSWSSEGRISNFGLFLPGGSTPYPPHDLPLVRAIRGEPSDRVEVWVRLPNSPDWKITSSAGRPVDVNGELYGGVIAIHDITAEKRAEAEIAQKNKDLETLLYVVSHDLREPLRGMRNFSHLVTHRYADRLDDKGKDFLCRIDRGAERMDRLLEDILVLSRANRLTKPAEQVEASAIVADVLSRLEEKVQSTRATIRMAPGLPRLYVDRTWATQAVYNLVCNALKFTREGEVPDVEIAPYDGQGDAGDRRGVGLVVRDRGPGVAPEHAERIFQLFQRAVGREIEGTGAGLAIVQAIAQRHGGRAWVQPRPGGGSEFVITFSGA